jgi:ubiquinone/menaquinone biosynthesis C-methylase UbiE
MMKSIALIESERDTDYNNIAQRYNITEKNAVTLWRLGYDSLLRYLNPIRNKSVLDYGCGSGTFCRFLSEKKAIVTGVDISENMIKVAKNSHTDSIDYYQITSGNLDFLPENTFDYVVSNFVFCTISTRQEIIKVMNLINRVLRENGSLIIMNTNWDKSNGQEFISFKLKYSRSLFPGKPITAVIKTEPPIILKDYYWSKANYSELLTESRFEIQGISEPLARGNHIPWIAEKSYPPYEIIYSTKFSPEAQP